MPLDGNPSEYVTVARELPAKEREPSLDGLIAWLETMPAEKEYCYLDTGECLAAQYHRHIGQKYEAVYAWNKTVDGPPDSTAGRIEWVACVEPRTFGAALTRARAALQRARAVRGG